MTRHRRDERGAVLVVTAVAAVGAMLMVALVVDLGQLRVDKRVNKGVADVAARAGIGRLAFGPWSGVCKARQFLLGNAGSFTSFDVGSETWSNGAAVALGTNPCPAVASAPDAVPCVPSLPSTWAKFQATAVQGRFTIEIQSGYVLPDARFPKDAARGDVGNVCDNLAVVISELEAPNFAPVGGAGPTLVRVRSVGRLNATETLNFVAALQLLERNRCEVLQVSGANTRVIAQPFGGYPGTIQVDSDGTVACSGKTIISAAQATSGGPSVLACSTNSSNRDCRPGTGDRPSRIGVYAANFNRPDIVATSFPTTYGDTKAVGSPRTGRKYTDQRYRRSVAALDQDAKSVLTGGLPPGCTLVLLNSCTGNGITWLVVGGLDCGTLGVFFTPLLGRASAKNIWFNCNLNVSSPLTLTAADSFIVVTGNLTVSSTFTIMDPRKVYVGGQSTGNKVGLDLTGGTLNMNAAGNATCAGRSGPGHANRLVIGHGAMKVSSGATARFCQTFMYLASGYDKVPTSDGTDPCTCGSWTAPGTINIGSTSFIDWSAPNEITGRLPEAAELATTNPFEDLALWTEAGGIHSMSGGSSTRMSGVYFMVNADSFSLAGGGSLPIDLSAQFVSRSLKVTGGATVNLVPNPEDSIPVTVYTTLLVR